jgi:hypothetical protein
MHEICTIVFMQKCRKPLWTEYPANTTQALNASGARVRIRSEAYEEAFSLEFEDTEEWSTDYYGTFKSQFRLLSQTICEKFCVLSAQTLSQYLGTLVQSEHASAGAAADCVEAKTLLLDLDILHYVYSPLLQTLIIADPSQKKTSNEGGKEDSNPVSEADRKAVLTITLATLGNVLQWKPRTASLQMEPYKILQYHYPILKLSVDHLGAAFSVLFEALSASIAASATAPGPKSPVRTAAQSAADAGLEQSTKISACVASLTQHCAQEIVRTGFFQEFFRQVELLPPSLSLSFLLSLLCNKTLLDHLCRYFPVELRWSMFCCAQLCPPILTLWCFSYTLHCLRRWAAS